jgi:hypothetical protein
MRVCTQKWSRAMAAEAAVACKVPGSMFAVACPHSDISKGGSKLLQRTLTKPPELSVDTRSLRSRARTGKRGSLDESVHISIAEGDSGRGNRSFQSPRKHLCSARRSQGDVEQGVEVLAAHTDKATRVDTAPAGRTRSDGKVCL